MVATQAINLEIGVDFIDDKINRVDGLTQEEGEVMDALVTAWNKFIGLQRQHPSELDEFCDGIHRCQYLLSVRISRREHPEGWPTKQTK